VPGSAGDPRCGSGESGVARATFTVSSPTSGETHTTGLPCQHWSLLGSEFSPTGYAYKDKRVVDGTVTKLTWKLGKALKVQLQGKGLRNLDYVLQVGVSESPVDAVLHSGPARVCVRCNATGRRDGSDGRRFGGRDCPPPGACPGSPSGAFLD